MEKPTRFQRRKATRAYQRWLPIEYAPEQVREHGLRDAHVRPLVSMGRCPGGLWMPAFRVAPEQAWGFPEIEIRAHNTFPAMIHDLDGLGSVGRYGEVVAQYMAAPANWLVENARTGGCHAVWTLERPVHRGAQARQKPLLLYGRISEYYRSAFEADGGYRAVLTHNPVEWSTGPGYKTHWIKRRPYRLEELADFIPFRWRQPRPAETAAGRNCDLFRHCMKWAGSPSNLRTAVSVEALRVNGDLTSPLDVPEVLGLARSVERYRRDWIHRGQFGPLGDSERREWGRRMGRRSGQARLRKTALRDRGIVDAVFGGLTLRQAAVQCGVSHQTVARVIKREAPLLLVTRPEPLSERRPWERQGISRRTWYRRRKKARKSTGGTSGP